MPSTYECDDIDEEIDIPNTYACTLKITMEKMRER